MRCIGLVDLYFASSLFTFVHVVEGLNVADVKYVANVALKLVTMLSGEVERREDLTKAEEEIRGITFDLFSENVSSDVIKGINLADYSKVIDLVFGSLGLPKRIMNELLAAQFVDDMQPVIRNFKFRKGEAGSFVFGRMAIVKYGGKIDMAYSVYVLDFKISPKVIEHSRANTFLGFTIGTSVWHEQEERDLSVDEQRYMETYFMRKVVEGFKHNHAGTLIEDNSCSSHENCS